MTTEETCRKLGVVGTGTMGTGIGITAARAGIETVMHDAEASRVDLARDHVVAFFDASVQRGKLDPDQRDAALNQLQTSTDVEALHDCDAVVEAVYEEVEVKAQLWSMLDDICEESALFVTNTSTLPVTAIAAGSRRPDRVVGMHFCNPAPLMPLIEVVDGLLTSDQTHARAMSLTTQLGKTAVEVQDTPGFIVNRFLIPFENDCIRALERGVATVEDIDRAVCAGLGYPMGPFTLLDIVGLDLHREVSMRLYEQLREPRFAPPPLVDRMIAAGHLGRKSGQGFYTYDEPGMFGA